MLDQNGTMPETGSNVPRKYSSPKASQGARRDERQAAKSMTATAASEKNRKGAEAGAWARIESQSTLRCRARAEGRDNARTPSRRPGRCEGFKEAGPVRDLGGVGLHHDADRLNRVKRPRTNRPETAKKPASSPARRRKAARGPPSRGSRVRW